MRWRLAGVWAASAVLAGCALPLAPRCAAGEAARAVELLYFGSERPQGGTVTGDDWAGFLRDEVTPRFPDGLTAWGAAGQWRDAAGRIHHEGSFVLNIVRDPAAEGDAAIRAIVAAYKRRFDQQAVLRVRTSACTSF